MGLKNPLAKSVKIKDEFWQKRQKLISDKIILYQWDLLNDRVEGVPKSHCLDNFKIAAGLQEGAHYGLPWQDHDLAKWMEAAAFSLMNYPNTEIEKILDECVELLKKVQQPDGYLNTFYTIHKDRKRFTDIAYGHELLNSGHFLEAAITYFQATGKREFLDIMIKNMDLIYDVVMNSEKNIFPGHEEIEIALLRLYGVTEDAKYLELAEHFIEKRGPERNAFAEDSWNFVSRDDKYYQLDYHQAHKPVREQDEAVGHCVRAVYLYTAMAMLARAKQDSSLEDVVKRLWDNMTEKKMYLTGGIGSQHYSERFTTAYDLPNDRAYNESCAAVGTIMMANGMLLNRPDASVADMMEKVLYNALLAGISYDGEKYFYVNPLEMIPEVKGYRQDLIVTRNERTRWYDCACCPTNIVRCISSLSQYIYTYDEERLYVNLFIGNEADIEGEKVTLESNFPWDGKIKLRTSGIREVFLKVPDWCQAYTVNGATYQGKVENGYLCLGKPREGAVTEIEFEMKPQLVYASVKVNDDCGKAAVQKGYLVYCAEEIDNGAHLQRFVLNGDLHAQQEEVLENIDVVYAEGYKEEFAEKLYSYRKPEKTRTTIRLVPYYIWNNRGIGEMRVWLRV